MGFALRHLMENSSYRGRLKPLQLYIFRQFDRSKRTVLICWPATHLAALWHLKWPGNSWRREKASAFSVSLTLQKPSEPVLVRGLKSARKHTLSSLLQKSAHVRAALYAVDWRDDHCLEKHGATCAWVAASGLGGTWSLPLYLWKSGQTVHGRNLIPEKSRCLPGAIERKSHEARWRTVAADVEVREIGGSHTDIVTSSYSGILARNIDETLDG